MFNFHIITTANYPTLTSWDQCLTPHHPRTTITMWLTTASPTSAISGAITNTVCSLSAMSSSSILEQFIARTTSATSQHNTSLVIVQNAMFHSPESITNHSTSLAIVKNINKEGAQKGVQGGRAQGVGGPCLPPLVHRSANIKVEGPTGVTRSLHQSTRKEHNKIMHSKHGNGRTRNGMKMASWNVNRGLLDGEARATAKFAELNSFVLNNNIHLMGVSETALHGPRSRVQRRTPVTSLTMSTELHLAGYKVTLPDTWKDHDTARLAVYVRDDVTTSRTGDYSSVRDLPVVSLEARLGKEAPTIVSFFYREYTGGV